MNDPKRIDELISEALAIEAEEAKEAGALGYMTRALVQATMPHKETTTNEFVRTNGAFTLSMMAPARIGLPYGSIPRLLLAWITTEAVKTKQRELILGGSLSSFLHGLGMEVTGGRWGSITRLKNQMSRLFSCFISCSYTDDELTTGKNLMIADEFRLWWLPKTPEQTQLFNSTILLSQPFFDEITQNPVPIDLRILNALQKSPMSIDIYTWLTYRMSYLRKPTVIPWVALQMQFGAEYGRTRDFKAAFLNQLKKVKILYPEVNVDEHPNGLLLRPSPTSIARTKIFLSTVDK